MNGIFIVSHNYFNNFSKEVVVLLAELHKRVEIICVMSKLAVPIAEL